MRSLAAVLCSFVFYMPVCEALTVRGASSCGDWVAERDKKSIGTFGNEAWLLGYLSGIATVTNTSFLKGTDNPSLFLWMDNYCRENPLSDLSDGGSKLYLELSHKK
jgi:hypothetical protein